MRAYVCVCVFVCMHALVTQTDGGTWTDMTHVFNSEAGGGESREKMVEGGWGGVKEGQRQTHTLCQHLGMYPRNQEHRARPPPPPPPPQPGT